MSRGSSEWRSGGLQIRCGVLGVVLSRWLVRFRPSVTVPGVVEPGHPRGVTVARVRRTRLLILRCPRAVEPIRLNNKIRWRVGANRVEVDAAIWHSKRMRVLNYEWSADESGVRVRDVRPAAVSQARELLVRSGEDHAVELARTGTDLSLLRRLNVMTAKGLLTNAGVIAFVGPGWPCLDYIRRSHTGGDSLSRIRRTGRSLLEELAEVFQAVDANTATVHLFRGLVSSQHREIPTPGSRSHSQRGRSQGMGCRGTNRSRTHRAPVEGNQSRGFYGGVTAENIITHPSTSRNRALSELLATLRVAERKGVGVDRMITDMVGVGHPAPRIEEISGPYVRTSLVGDDLDSSWITWLQSLDPSNEAEDLNSLLILRHLVDIGWIAPPPGAARLIQDTVEVAKGALSKLARAKFDRGPLMVPTEGPRRGRNRLAPSTGRRALSARHGRRGIAASFLAKSRSIG
ncbi:MAG: ATP-binding protein [Candidatus Nanopelagicales bacterium]